MKGVKLVWNAAETPAVYDNSVIVCVCVSEWESVLQMN